METVRRTSDKMFHTSRPKTDRDVLLRNPRSRYTEPVIITRNIHWTISIAGFLSFS